MSPQPNCCKRPTLIPLRALDEAPDGEIVLERCDSCRTFWRVTIQARMSMNGEDHEIAWFDRLPDREGDELLLECVR